MEILISADNWVIKSVGSMNSNLTLVSKPWGTKDCMGLKASLSGALTDVSRFP